MITLRKASQEDAMLLYKMQLKSFQHMLAWYQDYATNPGNEPYTKTLNRITMDNSDYYVVLYDGRPAGGIRVKTDNLPEYLCYGPLCVIPEMRNKGIMQSAMLMVEDLYPEAKKFALETIEEEKGNSHLYEKLGYRLTGEREKVNDKLTLVQYEKQRA